MTRRDDNHKAAEIIKDLAERVANLEERDRSSATPTLLRKQVDRVVADDSTVETREVTFETARWDESPGYDMAVWGE